MSFLAKTNTEIIKFDEEKEFYDHDIIEFVGTKECTYLDLNQIVCMIMNNELQEKKERMNLFATTIWKYYYPDDKNIIYGDVLIVHYTDIHDSVKVGM